MRVWCNRKDGTRGSLLERWFRCWKKFLLFDILGGSPISLSDKMKTKGAYTFGPRRSRLIRVTCTHAERNKCRSVSRGVRPLPGRMVSHKVAFVSSSFKQRWSRSGQQSRMMTLLDGTLLPVKPLIDTCCAYTPLFDAIIFACADEYTRGNGSGVAAPWYHGGPWFEEIIFPREIHGT